MADFQTALEERVQRVQSILKVYMPEEKGLQKRVAEAMNYSINAGGKRLRPVLMLETYRLFGGEGDIVEPFMAAMEMIHTYSLVHDDLPAMDNDMYRRGRKSTHAAFGEAMGILAGDALLNYAFETASAAVERECTPRTARAMRILAVKAGISGMIGGQVVDIESAGREISRDTLLFLHENKTGALIESAMMIGAVLAGAGEDQIRLVERIGSDIGLAFQIQDDILDVTGSEKELGKPVGSDAKNEKVTYVTFAGLEAAREQVRELSDRAERHLAALGGADSFLAQLIRSLVNRRS